jgi:hypothetical protein
VQLRYYDADGNRQTGGVFPNKAVGVTVFELAKVMGTSVRMIEKHYGALLDGAHAGLVGRLDAIEAELEQAHAK